MRNLSSVQSQIARQLFSTGERAVDLAILVASQVADQLGIAWTDGSSESILASDTVSADVDAFAVDLGEYEAGEYYDASIDLTVGDYVCGAL